MSNNADGVGVDTLIETAARALAAGDALAALKCVALRDDARALALRGMAMAQLGDLVRARALLRDAARRFGTGARLAQARCLLAAAEIALAMRDLGLPARTLTTVRATLEALGDPVNAAHAGSLEARRLLLIGHLDEAERVLDGLDVARLPAPSRVACELVAAGIAMRRIRTAPGGRRWHAPPAWLARRESPRCRRRSRAPGVP